jgi:cytochrome c
MLRKFSIALALLAGTSLAAQAAGDAKAGAQVFKKCAQCHTNEKGGGNGLGPNLFGVFGRKSASLPDFQYSSALKASGIVWTEANLTKWVTKPGAMVPGTKMMFAGLSSKSQQANVVAYLATLK